MFNTQDLIHEYYLKDEVLRSQFGENIKPREFYNELFDGGIALQKRDGVADGKGNMIVVADSGKEKRRYTIHPDNNFEDLLSLPEEEFVFASPISYFGKNRTLKNARFMYAMTIDLDKVELENLHEVIYQIDNEVIPRPTYIANSGTGLHLYYKFETAVPMFPSMQNALKLVRTNLIKRVWNRYTSKKEDKEYQSINQGFRLVGSITKNLADKDEQPYFGTVKVWKTGDNITLDYLTEHILMENIDLGDLGKYGIRKYDLETAKKLFPDWYKKRIVEGKPTNQWFCKRDLYDWWIEQIKAGAVEGHRYWCIYALSTYAVKCGISIEELKKDAMELQPFLDKSGLQPFTKKDVRDALKIYKDTCLASRFTRRYIEMMTAISIPPNKRNGRKQQQHLERARAVQNIDYPNGEWREGNGRKPKKEIVKKWKLNNPEGKKADCIRDTGLTKPTVYKWWND